MRPTGATTSRVVSVIRLQARSTDPSAFSSSWAPKLWKNWRLLDALKDKEAIMSSFQSGCKTLDGAAKKVRDTAYVLRGRRERKNEENNLEDMKQIRRATHAAEARKELSTNIARLAGTLKKARAVALLRASVLTGRVREWRQAQRPPGKLPTEFEGDPIASVERHLGEKRERR